jgi:hypothetical protein
MGMMFPATNNRHLSCGGSPATGSGHERKTTGSYYTPTSLITCLLDSALDPVLDEALQKPDPEQAVRNLKVCDPACGSGHFLIAAAHRVAKRLAFVRTGEEEPPPEAIRTALRDVIGHSIYGVDINPMAVELCKVALWMEALEPGKPLSFLDHHIQCGNSLLGTTPALLAKGIPDEAFQPIEGDLKARCTELKKQNKREREEYAGGQMYLFDSYSMLGNLPAEFGRLNSAPDSSPDQVAAIRDRYAELVHGTSYQNARLWADTWCAAFVWKKDNTEIGNFCPTERDFRNVERSAQAGLLPHVRAEVERLRNQYQFFHWHLAFPDVFRPPGKDEPPENEQSGWCGGFDVVLGNPPWEHAELKQKEWFADRRPDIANAPNDAARKRMIAALAEEDAQMLKAYQDDVRKAEGVSHFMRSSGRFPLCGRGRVNTYALFAETDRLLIAPQGRLGCVLPSGIATDDTTKEFFRELMSTGSLVSLFGFENEEFLFPGVHHSTKFCLLTLSAHDESREGADFIFFARRLEDLEDHQRRFTLNVQDLALINPNTGTCPIFRYGRDANLTRAIHSRIPVLLSQSEPGANLWGVSFKQGLFNMASDSGLFRTAGQLEQAGWTPDRNLYRQGDKTYLPLYEAKMVNMFDHRHGSVTGGEDLEHLSGVPAVGTTDAQHRDPDFCVLPRYWVPQNAVTEAIERAGWKRNALLCFRDVARCTDVRTAIHAILPVVGIGHKAPILMPDVDQASLMACLLANVNSFVFDYVARQKVGGASLSFFIYKQLPVLPPDTYEQAVAWSGGTTLGDWFFSRSIELAYTAWDLQPFALECGYDGPPFRWDAERRLLLRCELDAAFLHLYGITRDDVAYIMDTFPVVRRRDEELHGVYRTKETILAVYDALAEAASSGRPCQTLLNPPPGDPSLAHPARMAASPSREEVRVGRIVSFIVLLLREWKKPVARSVLEAAIVLMINDQARRQILGRTGKSARVGAKRPAPDYVLGLDGLLQDIQITNFVEITTVRKRQAVRLGTGAPSTDSAPAADVERLRETFKALEILGEDEVLSALEEVVHERYALVP